MKIRKAYNLYMLNKQTGTIQPATYVEAGYHANNEITTKYIGNNPFLKGRNGTAWYCVSEDIWYFTPKGDAEDVYRVKDTSLDLY